MERAGAPYRIMRKVPQRSYAHARQPLFWRSFAYFCYRYFLKLGFLDGREGFLWHFMQGWWYRTLVDARQFEKQKKGSANTER